MKKIIEFIAMLIIYPIALLGALFYVLLAIPISFMGPALFSDSRGLIPSPNKKGWAVIYAFYAIFFSCIYGVLYLIVQLV
ncbi:hypothetical protein [Photobacterium sanguinicancri]|uniref:hypothetical protein n=1 Tax=Photobacterium sanguinicancri TaxID=875932 RepID=UPI0024808B4F|nr:hypothetical protein [Photobacterium sanguinicancri]